MITYMIGGKRMVKDMSVGSPFKLLLSFSIPMLIGNIFQQFYSMVDTIVVGRFISVQALAALGATGALNFLVLGFIIGVANGFSVIIAQRFGEKNFAAMRRTVAMGAILSVAVAVIVTFLSVALCEPLLRMMQTPADIIEDAKTYINIIFWGIIATMFYNFVSAVLRAMGDSKTPLYFLVFSSLVNVVLDLVFVIVFRMGVAGAGWATVISQALSFVLCYFYMRKKHPILHLTKEDWKFDSHTSKNLLRIGVPMGLQSSVTAIGVVILQGAVNSFGSVTVAAYTAASKVEQVAIQPMITFGLAISTFAGQNLGAKKLGRIREGVRQCILISMVSCVLFAVLIWVFGDAMVSLFVSGHNQELFDQARLYLNMVSLFFCVLGLLFIFRSVLQGLGNALVPMLSGIMELVMRVIVALVLSQVMGYFGICLAGPVAWTGATILLVISYFVVMGKMQNRIKN